MSLSLLLGFLPWIVFGFLPKTNLQQFDFAIIAMILLNTVCNFRSIVKWYILPVSTTIFFLLILLVLQFTNFSFMKQYIWIFSSSMLMIIAFGSLLFGKPFTLQYAREKSPPERWDDPRFIFINQVLTCTWGMIFMFTVIIHLLHMYYLPAFTIYISVAITLLYVFGFWFNVWFPKYYRKKSLK